MPRILIVDDDHAIRGALTAMLEDEGHHVVGAGNGREALAYLRGAGEPPGLILLDLAMPIMSGWEFREEQQRDPALAAIPVVVISADRGVRQKAESIEADGYLGKPVDIDDLLAAVARHSR